MRGILCIGWRIGKVTLHGDSESNSPRHPNAPTSEHPSHQLTKAPCSTQGGQIFAPEVVAITIALRRLCRYDITKTLEILTPPSAKVRSRNHARARRCNAVGINGRKNIRPARWRDTQGPSSSPRQGCCGITSRTGRCRKN